MNRSAAFGTLSTAFRDSTSTVTFAVMPGRNRRSSLRVPITVVYVTTLDSVMGSSRTCETLPSNVSSGNASTVNLTGSPAWMRPMSASSMRVSTCICFKSFAITNSSGACRLAATVWPTSTEREITTPSMGERIVVFWRSSLAAASSASACMRSARRCSTSETAASTSAWETKFPVTSSCARVALRRASWYAASDRASAASACTTRVRKLDGSICASTCPALTREL